MTAQIGRDAMLSESWIIKGAFGTSYSLYVLKYLDVYNTRSRPMLSPEDKGKHNLRACSNVQLKFLSVSSRRVSVMCEHVYGVIIKPIHIGSSIPLEFSASSGWDYRVRSTNHGSNGCSSRLTVSHLEDPTTWSCRYDLRYLITHILHLYAPWTKGQSYLECGLDRL